MTLEGLNRIDMSKYEGYLKDSQLGDFVNWAGYEHYRLLNHLCAGKPLVYDIGTYKGSSAIAMSSAKKVVSYNVEDQRESKKPKNVTFKIGDCLTDSDLIKADVIMLDTYHDGEFEKEFYEFIKSDFKGVLVLDDIHLNKPMEAFWRSITEPKEDLTKIGHYSGTGVVYFDGRKPKRCSSCG